MTNKSQNSNFKYLIAILIITAIFASGCGRKDSVANAAEISKAPAGVSTGAQGASAGASTAVDAVNHTITAFDLEGLADDGSKKWDVKGQSAEALTEDQVKLNNITASTYGKDTHATITADTGMYDKSKNNVRLEQNVKAVIENTQKGSGDILNLSAGTGDEAGVKKAADGTDKSKKTKTIITCDAEVEFNYEKNEGHFNKNVHVINDEGTIDADKITVYLDSATKTVKTIVAEGNVKIRRGENMTYSDKATYLAAEKKIVLSGQPKLVIYQEGNAQDNFLVLDKK
ncbi:MAG: LptA/OstA family protein [Candidatus Omnitrophica bacterium]|nr:LptA/OstA family protein [Candidatus Omnitrophota bacterium]